jgi:hypothetical protein
MQHVLRPCHWQILVHSRLALRMQDYGCLDLSKYVAYLYIRKATSCCLELLELCVGCVCQILTVSNAAGSYQPRWLERAMIEDSLWVHHSRSWLRSGFWRCF